jgi:hypothetical protein
MSDEKIRLCKINVELLQSGVHGIKTFFSIQSGIDNQISV